jgi:hypothetical protein
MNFGAWLVGQKVSVRAVHILFVFGYRHADVVFA